MKSASVQRKAANDYGWRSCRAKMMAPRHFGLFYYEVEIMHRPGAIAIGLAPKAAALYHPETWHNDGFYAYTNDGYFLGHSVNGMPPFDVGDTIGVGVNLGTRQIIYTKNGRRLDTTNLYVETVDHFPAVSLKASPDAVEANFGPNFRYNISQEFGDGIVP